jgi:T5SS/PEP-CTERM-associated repeat protein
MFIGTADSSVGTVVVDGADVGSGLVSTLDVNGWLILGGQFAAPGGTGTLTVVNDGRVEVESTIQIWSGSSVTVNSPSEVVADRVDISFGGAFNANAGSALYVNQLIGFGNNPVIDGNLLFGQAQGASTASYSVGAGQSLDVGSNLVIGVDKPATLTINNAGFVQNLGGFLGGLPGSDGSSVTVSDSGTTWEVRDTLNVGGDGFSTGGASSLLIENDAVVDVAGMVTVWPTSTVTLDDASLIATGVNLTGGTLQGNGPVQLGGGTLTNGGIMGPGLSAGKIDVLGSYTQTSNGDLGIELAGAGGVSGVDHDQLNLTGSASLAGTLTLLLISPYEPGFSDAYQVLATGTGVTGRFDLIYSPSLGSAGLRIDYSDPMSVYIRAGLRGDLNLDGFVGIADLNIVLANWNQNATAGVWGEGDPSGDAFVGIADLNEILGNWNAGTPPTAGANIPEPATLGLLLAGSVMLLRRAG